MRGRGCNTIQSPKVTNASRRSDGYAQKTAREVPREIPRFCGVMCRIRANRLTKAQARHGKEHPGSRARHSGNTKIVPHP